jgi:hypothetical protein
MDKVMARPLRIKYEGAYYHVIARGNEEDLDDPLRNSYAGSILGGKPFIKEVLNRLKDDTHVQKEETSHRAELQLAFASEQIADAIGI